MINLEELFGDQSWRILPLDALPQDKFKADMAFQGLDDQMFTGHTVAHGVIYNDSRGELGTKRVESRNT